jgi:hypothetical protein
MSPAVAREASTPALDTRHCSSKLKQATRLRGPPDPPMQLTLVVNVNNEQAR